MKSVGSSERHVEITGVSETAQMTIHADARMFKNLLDSIYSEKEKTVVRELMANAFDAHIEGGCPDREIEVHLPTLMDPTLVVRDFGVGMSHEFMMKLYSALGFSSKADSNTQTGMFGVGSKSPLSVTDTFTVKAFDLDGTVRTYIITIPNDEHPQISYAFTTKQEAIDTKGVFDKDDIPIEPTYERGIEITVPLDHKKRQAVLDGLASQHFCWFDKKVKFLGALDEIKHKFYVSIAQLTPGLYIATPAAANEDRYNTDKWQVFVRQGAAVYPLNQNQMRGKLTQTHNDIITNLCTASRHVLIDLPLGTANVTMAREAIQYDTMSSDNIAKVVAERFAGFAKLLEDTIGDARDFQVAQQRIVQAFYPPAEHGKIIAQRLASTLLNLVEKKVNSNWKTWADAQPDVPGYEIDKITGKPTTKLSGKMVRPKLRPPQRQVTMALADFPEGKVLLHKGTLIGGRYDSGPNIGGAETSISFKAPNVIFVLPSHLREWKDRIKDYCATTFKNDTLPQDRAHGVPIQVIRCAKRNVEDVKKALLEFGVLVPPVVMEDLPNIAQEDIKRRNFSKTSVYPWKGSQWDETKLEPDYALPAYYVARVGIAHDVHLLHPTKPEKKSASGLARQEKTTNYNMQHILIDARKLNIIDATTPIYRVTENQAERISQACQAWVHLPTFIWAAIENKLVASIKTAIGKSRLGQSTNGLTNNLMAKVKSTGANASTNKFTAPFDLFCELVAKEPLFATVAAVKWAVHNKPNDFKEDSTFDRLFRAVYQYGSTIDVENINKFDRLQASYDERYKYVMMFDNGSSVEWIPHARAYLDGAYKMWNKEKLSVNLSDYPEFQGFAAELHKDLAAIQAAINKTAVVEEEDELDVVQPKQRRTAGNLR